MGVLVVAIAVATPTAAFANISDDGLWYFDALKVQAAHDAGFTGEGVTIAVIDSPINLDVPTLSGADIRVLDSSCFREDGTPLPSESDVVADSEHGTNVVSMIVGSGAGYEGQQGVRGVAPDATILYYPAGDGDAACYSEDGDFRFDAIAEAMDMAVAAGADIISTSIGQERGPDVFNSVIKALNAGVVMVMSVANQTGSRDDLPGVGISGFNGVIGVQAFDKFGNLSTHDDLVGGTLPNLDPDTEVVAPGVGILYQGVGSDWRQQKLINGSSFATPLVAGFMADVAQKYPGATSSQLIQTLISNTGGNGGVPVFDPTGAVGWGSASLTNMLAVDPSQYPDSNPLVLESGTPSPAEIAAGPEVVETYTPSPVAPVLGEGVPTMLIVGGVVFAGALLITAIAIVLFTRARRQRKNTDTPNGGA